MKENNYTAIPVISDSQAYKKIQRLDTGAKNVMEVVRSKISDVNMIYAVTFKEAISRLMLRNLFRNHTGLLSARSYHMS